MADAGNAGRARARPAPRAAAAGLAGVPGAGPAPGARRACPLANVLLHTAIVQVKWLDTRTAVPALSCRILLGDAVIHPGPLANGTMGLGGLVGGNYEVTLPEVDQDEWAAE